jgi:hypothetical protein
MEFSKTIFAILLGWGLAEYGKIIVDKRSDKKKLNTLLFYLLELRYHLKREFSFETDFVKYISNLEVRLTKEFGPEVKIGIEQAKPLFAAMKQKHFSEDTQVEMLEKNIDNVIIDLAEILPVFAYELSGQHRIKERLEKAELLFSEADEYLSQLPFDIKSWFEPKVTEQLIKDLDDNIIRIANKLENRTYNEVRRKLKHQTAVDNSDVNDLINDYIDQIKKSIK